MNEELPFHAISVALDNRSYVISIGSNLLDADSTFADLPLFTSALVVSNTTVAPLYLQRFRVALEKHSNSVSNSPPVYTLVLPDGESYKTWETLNLIFDALLQHQCDRKTLVFALGGGVVGDMTGFAAACFMRGVPFVQVPTTLLAQVDSSVGGKTGINHPLGKNMVGAFYQPLKVICDLDVLSTLPAKELSAGLAEVIKYGPIADPGFFDWVEANIESLKRCDKRALAYAVRRSCEIKAWVVAQDERESGIRAILNFGHTFGHAIETGLGYGQWLHGEAVGCGMVMAAHLSHRLGGVDTEWLARLTQMIRRAGLPVKPPILCSRDNAGRYLDLMRLDKKSEAGAIRFVLIENGKAVVRSAPDALVREMIDALCAS